VPSPKGSPYQGHKRAESIVTRMTSTSKSGLRKDKSEKGNGPHPLAQMLADIKVSSLPCGCDPGCDVLVAC
jgi:hypothetical protein